MQFSLLPLTFTIPLLLALATPPAVAQATTHNFVCPAMLDITETMANTAQPWEAVIDQGRRGVHLIGVTMYLGHPDQMASLVPDKTSVKNRKQLATWHLSGGKTEVYWLACNYSNTRLMLAQKLPASVTSCEVRQTLLPNGKAMSVDAIQCQ